MFFVRNAVFAVVMVSLVASAGETSAQGDKKEREAIAKEVATKIAELPQFTAFDWVTFDVSSANVVDLKGMAISTALRTDAEEVAKKVKGVEGVHNSIEYVRRSMIDDKIRVMAYNAIYQTYLAKYQKECMYQFVGATTAALPRGPHPIQILVDKGNVTLQGHVHSAEDKATASKAVENVGGLVKSLTNLLTVTHE